MWDSGEGARWGEWKVVKDGGGWDICGSLLATSLYFKSSTEGKTVVSQWKTLWELNCYWTNYHWLNLATTTWSVTENL